MKRNQIVGFGSADGIGNAFGCLPTELSANGECIPTTKVCPPGAHVVNLSPGSKSLVLDCECEPDYIYANGICQKRDLSSGSSGGYVVSPPLSFSKAGVGSVGMLIVLGIVGWAAYSIFSK